MQFRLEHVSLSSVAPAPILARWRLIAVLTPLAWLGLVGGAAWISTQTIRNPTHRTSNDPSPVDHSAENQLVGRLVDVLYPPPAIRGGIGPRAVIDAAALAAWMTDVESSNPSTRMQAL